MLSKITFALTGATGLLGRNLLLEIIKQNYKKLSSIEILLLGRNSKTDSLHQRIMNIIKDEAFDYIDDQNLDREGFLNEIKKVIKCYNIILGEPYLAMSQDELSDLKTKKIDYFFHIAALTNLWHDEKSKIDLERINVDGTKGIIQLVKELGNVGELSYVGTAYSCGKTYGNIEPDYINISNGFRNNYERTKLEAELLVRNFEKETGQKCRYFRPSVVCGRMIERELGAVSKFDVFYGWGLFFLELKKKLVGNIDNLINEKCNLNLRYHINFNAGLNIVPVDYCAKIAYKACITNHSAKHIHLTYHKEIPHTFYFPQILKSLNIEGAVPTSEHPQNLNYNEKLYYRSAGKIYAEYMTSEPMYFNMSNVENLTKSFKFILPNLTEINNFYILLNYASHKKYGIK